MMNDVLSGKAAEKYTWHLCCVSQDWTKSIVWALFKPNVLHFVFPVRHVWQDTVRPNGPVWLLSTVGLHAEVESALSAVWQRPFRIYQWHGATTRYLLFVWVDFRGWFTSRWNFTHFRLTILTDCAGWGLWWLFLIYITILELYGQKKFHPVPTRQKSCTQLKKVTTEENLICLHAACVVSSKCGSHWHWNVNTMILAKVSTVAF